MTETCSHIEPLYSQARSLGCSVKEISSGWSEARLVVHILQPLPTDLRSASGGVAAPVRYYSSPRTPYNPADEGFYCTDCKVDLSFPAASA